MKITKHSNPSWRDEFRRSLLDMHLRKYVVVVGGVVVGVDCVIHPCYLFFDLQFFLQTTPFHSFGQTWTMRKKPEKGTRRRCCKYWRTWVIHRVRTCNIFVAVGVCADICNMWYVDIFIFIVQHDEQRLHRVLGSPRERSSMCVHTSTTQSG